MNDSLARLIYTLLPCLVGAYAVAVFLTTRPISATRSWLLGLLIAFVLTLGASAVIARRFGIPVMERSVLESFASLYFIPAIVLVASALGLRSRGVNRNTGVVVLVALFLGAAWFGRSTAYHFLDLVGAVH